MRVGFVLQDAARRPTGLDVYTRNLWDALSDLGSEVELVPVTLPVRWAAKALLRTIWEQIYLPLWALWQKIDLIHVPAGSAPVVRGQPCVITLHDLGDTPRRGHPSSLGPRLYFERVVPASARYATAVVADSEATKRDAVDRLGIPPERITVVPLAPSPTFRPLPESTIAKTRSKYGLRDSYFLQVGAPIPRKNLSGSLTGFARFLARNPGAPTTFVAVGGDGSSTPAIPEEAARLVDQGRIRLLGHLPQDDLVALYNGALAVLLPSFYEGFGLPLVEAFACQTSAIASRVASLPEVGGDAALYIDPNDPDTIAGAMEQYIESPVLRDEMRARARRRSRRFSPRAMAEGTLAVYREALEPRGSSTRTEQSSPKVLFVRLDSLGDVVLTTPCFESLKRRYPGGRVDVVVQPGAAPVLRGNAHVDRVFTLAAPWHGAWRPSRAVATMAMLRRLRRERYDYVITPRRDLDDALFAWLCGGEHTLGFDARRTRFLLSDSVRFQPTQHTVDNHLRLMSLLGCDAGDISPAVNCTAGDSEDIGVLLAEADESRPLIGLAPFAASETKTLDASRTAALIDGLSETLGASIVLLGDAARRVDASAALSRAAAPVIDLVGRTSIPALCDVLRRCSLLVSVDSAPMHIAAALGIPTVALFGDEDPVLWGPYGGGPHRVLQSQSSNGQADPRAVPIDAVVAEAGGLVNTAAEAEALHRGAAEVST